MSAEQEICLICLDEVCSPNDVKLDCPCPRTYHQRCLDEWLTRNMRCPNCQTSLRRGNITVTETEEEEEQEEEEEEEQEEKELESPPWKSLLLYFAILFIIPITELYKLGFGTGKTDSEICALITNIDATIWTRNMASCTDLIDNRLHSIYIMTENLLYYFGVYQTASWAARKTLGAMR